MDDDRKFSYFFLGLGIGVAVGIIFAPKAGQDTRHLIRSKADEGKEFIKRRSEEIRGTAGEMIEKGRGMVGRQKEQLDQAMEAGKQAYREALGRAPKPEQREEGATS